MRVYIFFLVLVFINLISGCKKPRPSIQETDSMTSGKAMYKLLSKFGEAWNRHDLDDIMLMMTDDCIFEASGGDNVNGEQYKGQEEVRIAFAAVFKRFPDANWSGTRHFVDGDRGLSEWTFTGTHIDGRYVEVKGCDLFTFREGKIAIKNSFRKNRP